MRRWLSMRPVAWRRAKTRDPVNALPARCAVNDEPTELALLTPADPDDRTLLVRLMNQRLAKVELHDLHVIRIGEHDCSNGPVFVPVLIVGAGLEESVHDWFRQVIQVRGSGRCKESISRVKSQGL